MASFGPLELGLGLCRTLRRTVAPRADLLPPDRRFPDRSEEMLQGNPVLELRHRDVQVVDPEDVRVHQVETLESDVPFFQIRGDLSPVVGAVFPEEYSLQLLSRQLLEEFLAHEH